MPDTPINLYCRECEYNLRGLTESRCPECGTEFDRDDPESYLRFPTPFWQRHEFLWFVVGVVCFFFIWIGPWFFTLGVMSFVRTIDGIELGGDPVDTVGQKILLTLVGLSLTSLGLLFVFYRRRQNMLHRVGMIDGIESDLSQILLEYITRNNLSVLIIKNILPGTLGGMAGVTLVAFFLAGDNESYLTVWMIGAIALIPISLWSSAFRIKGDSQLVSALIWGMIGVWLAFLLITALQDRSGSELAMLFLNASFMIGFVSSAGLFFIK